MSSHHEPPRRVFASSRTPRPFGERARRRLCIAARLLGRRSVRADDPGDDWCHEVLVVLDRLPAARRERLRDLVDWVESYDGAEVKRRWRG